MFRFPKFLIFFIAVVVSFVFYQQSLKLNPEYQTLRKIEAACRAFGCTDLTGVYSFREQIFNNIVVPTDELRAKSNLKLLIYNVLILCLIVQLFTVFAVSESEVFISMTSLLPVFLYVSYTKEGWLVPFYFLVIPLFAYLFSRLKKLVFNKIPNWFT